MTPVQGKDVVLKIPAGLSGYQPIACNVACSLQITTDILETTFLDSGADRSFIPNKHTKVLRGNGPIVLSEAVTAASIVLLQLNRTIVAWTFTLTDTITTVVYSGNGFFTDITLDGTMGNLATCDYTIQITGAITVTGTPPGSEGDDAIWEYNALGGETTIGDAVLVGATILEVLRNGIGIEVITVGTPDMSQVKFNSGAGTLEFSMALSTDEWILVLYQ